MNSKPARRKNRPRADAAIPAWLSAFCLLVAAIAAWLFLRKVIPAGGLAAAVAVLALGLATWWPVEPGPFARGQSLRPFRLLDAIPVGSVILGLSLFAAALLGWGAKPLGELADTVSDMFWGDPDEKKKQEDKKADAGDEDAQAPPMSADNWKEWPVPDGSDATERGDAPPMILSYQDPATLAAFRDGPVYVRVAALDIAGPMGAEWSPAPVEPRELTDAADGREDGVVEVPGSSGDASAPAFAYSLFTPNSMVVVPSLQGMIGLASDSVLRDGEGLWSVPPPGRTNFRGSSRPLVWGAPGLPDVVAVPSSDPRAFWTELPDDRIANYLRETAATIAPGRPLAERVSAIPVWLSQRCRYSETVVNARGQSAVLNFLESERAGSCEHFATAAVLLLRAMDVPSRLCFGYAGGSLAAASKSITYGARDFHAWPEIHLPGAGWTIFECTPGGQGANRPPIPQDEDEIAAPPPEPQALEPLASPARLLALLGGGAFFLILGWLAARWRRSRLIREVEAAAIDTHPQPSWFVAFLDASVAIGAPRRPGRTAREHLAFLQRAHLSSPDIEKLVHYYHRTRYDGSPADPRMDGEMLQITQAWLASHRPAAGRDKTPRTL